MRKRHRTNKDGTFTALACYKDLNGIWKQKTKKGFSTANKADQWAIAKEKEMEDLVKHHIVDSDATIHDLFDAYIDEIQFLQRRQNTIIAYQSAQKFFKDLTKPVKNLTPYDIRNYYRKKVQSTGHSYAKYINYLSIVLNYAKNTMKIITYNPAHGMDTLKPKDTRTLFITKELFENILFDCKKEQQKILIEFLYYTGVRIHEALGLTIFDVGKDFVNINKQWSPLTKDFQPVKNKNGNRTIPISAELSAKIKSLPVDTNGRMFTLTSDKVNYYLKQFNVSCHCFRHTRSTILLSEGIDPTIVALVLGDEIETIMKKYVEINQDKKDAHFDKIRKLG